MIPVGLAVRLDWTAVNQLMLLVILDLTVQCYLSRWFSSSTFDRTWTSSLEVLKFFRIDQSRDDKLIQVIINPISIVQSEWLTIQYLFLFRFSSSKFNQGSTLCDSKYLVVPLSQILAQGSNQQE